MSSGDLTDAQWERLEAVLPPIPKMGRPPSDRRQVFYGIWLLARTGSPWRDLPERYVLKKLQVKADADGIIEWEVSVDSTVCRAHQHAAGARKRGLTIRAGRVRTASRPSRTTTVWDARAAD